MRNNFLAQSLAKNAAENSEKKPLETGASAPSVGGPKALRSMATAIESLTSHAPQEIDAAQIADSEIKDRIDTFEGLDNLIESIRSSGQKLPILVRNRKANSGPLYEVVYGRRRLAACRVLGIKVKAIVREMDHTEALMSQALENSARMDRSFIEQALFALRLSQAGLSSEQIIEGLAINPTLLKRLMSVSKALPADLIETIGAAHEAGRRPWLELKDLIKENPQITQAEILEMIDPSLGSHERLLHLIEALKQRQEQTRAAQLDATTLSVRSVNETDNQIEESEASKPKKTEKHHTIGSLIFTSGHKRAVLTAGQKEDRGFLDYLAENLDQLYAQWAKTAQSK